MSDQGPLIVPIVVEALVVNDHVRAGGGDAFYRARDAIQQPEVPGQRPAQKQQRLHRRPSSYYTASVSEMAAAGRVHDRDPGQRGGRDHVPVVPNRWLVVRYSGVLTARRATAWLVVSDDRTATNNPQNASQVGAMYVAADPQSGGNTPMGVRIGRSVPLATETWTETGATLELKAVTPGNAAFAYYQPACNNVFSLMDPLDGHAAGSRYLELSGVRLVLLAPR